MFTGIIEEVGEVTLARGGNLVITASRVLERTEIGGSMAINGVCLTTTGFNGRSFSVDIMPETLKRTNLGFLSTGDKVNLERPLVLGEALGGHLVQGHVDATGKIISVMRNGEAMLIRVEALEEVMHYVVEKGFIAVDGVSLTVVARDTNSFQISIVGYTREHTTLGIREVGNLVNLEVDIIAKYVEQLIKDRSSGVTVDFLKECGYY